ncbi:hypothetical protein BJI47_12770 [Rhodococcus sp. 1168]|nr:hypothetical protein BJI47_12770 [Rhodococcus sp. 1168]
MIFDRFAEVLATNCSRSDRFFPMPSTGMPMHRHANALACCSALRRNGSNIRVAINLSVREFDRPHAPRAGRSGAPVSRSASGEGNSK